MTWIQSYSLNSSIFGTPINEMQFSVIRSEQLLKSILTTSGKSTNYRIEILIALPEKLCGPLCSVMSSQVGIGLQIPAFSFAWRSSFPDSSDVLA